MKFTFRSFVGIVTLCYLVIIFYVTYPLIFHLGSLSYGTGDELLVAYFQSWVQHSLLTNPLHVFQANIYFPYHNTFAYSEPFILTSILTYIPTKIIGQPIASMNVAYLFALFSLSLSICLTSFYLTKHKLISFVSGLLVLLSPYVIDKAVQIQVILCFFVPVSWICLLEFLKTKKRNYWYAFLLCFVLQWYTSLMPAYFILISNAILLLFVWLQDKKIWNMFFQKQILLAALLSIILVMPLLMPFYHVSKEFSYVRDLRDTIHFALQPEDLLYPNYHTRLEPFLSHVLVPPASTPPGEVKSGYIGAVFSILILFSLGYLVYHRKKQKNTAWIFSGISLCGLVLSFGPFLHLGRVTIHQPFPIPLPYLLTYYFLPGFQAFRNSSRFEMLFILAGSVFIAIVLSEVMKKRSARFQWVIISLFLIGIISEYNFPMQFYPIAQVKDFPKIEKTIATLAPQSVLIHLPAYTWDMAPYNQIEIDRQYFSTLHFKPMVNGYSGFSPLAWQEMIRTLDVTFPDKTAVQELKKMGVTYIVIHKKEYDTLHDTHFLIKHTEIKSGDEIMSLLERSKAVTLITKEGDDYLFKIL